MLSIFTRFLKVQMRLFKPIMGRFSIKTGRALQDKLGEIEEKTAASKVTITPVEMSGFEASFAAPKTLDDKNRRVILYLHGGGYVAGNLAYACGAASMFAAELDQRILSVAYRLAPENPFPAALEDALASYQYLLDQGYSAKDISLIGESAGGGLVFCLCLLLKQKGLPLPAALVGISPWTDLTLSGESYEMNYKKDPALSLSTLQSDIEAYAQGQEKNPLVSPIFGDLSGFPPSLVFVGSEEMLLDDAKTLAYRLNRAGSRCELVIGEGLWHVYILYMIPEAAEAIKKIRFFLEQQNGSSGER